MKIASAVLRIILAVAVAAPAYAQFSPGQTLGAAQLNAALAAPTITGGSINNAPIGAKTPSTGVFTTLTATTFTATNTSFTSVSVTDLTVSNTASVTGAFTLPSLAGTPARVPLFDTAGTILSSPTFFYTDSATTRSLTISGSASTSAGLNLVNSHATGDTLTTYAVTGATWASGADQSTGKFVVANAATLGTSGDRLVIDATGAAAAVTTSGSQATSIGFNATNTHATGATINTLTALAGDAQTTFAVTGATWTAGVDQSTGKYVIASAATLGTSEDKMSIADNAQGSITFGETTGVTFQVDGASNAYRVQNVGLSAITAGFGQSRFDNTANGATFVFGKSKGVTSSSFTVVAANDTLGQIAFNGADGSIFRNAAMIRAAVDGTPGNADMPGRLELMTTPDGGVTPAVNLTLFNDGKLAVGQGTATDRFEVQRGSTMQFALTSGATSTGLQMRTAQATAPTCTTNCGTSPSVAGTDTAGVITMGASGVPASGFVLTFNGTWNSAPVCTVTASKAGMVAGKAPIVAVTTTTTITVTTNGTAPATSDTYNYVCIGKT